MFDQPRHVRSTFGLTFPEIRNIADSESQFYQRLRDHYFPAKLLAADANTQALLFQSQHGHSQIIVSTADVVLNVTYSPDWQTDEGRVQTYVVERSSLLFDLLEIVSEMAPSYCGAVSHVRLKTGAR